MQPDMQWPRIELLPRSHDLPDCMQLSTSPCPFVAQFSHWWHSVFGLQVCLAEVSRIQFCNLSQPRRQISAWNSPDQGERLLPGPDCAGKLIESRRHVTHPRRSQAEASHVIARLFFGQSNRAAQKHCLSRTSAQSLPKHCCKGLRWHDNEQRACEPCIYVLTNATWLREMIAVADYSRASNSK
jgi:hypothetical protein